MQARGSRNIRRNFKQTSLGSLSLATLPEGESKRESGNQTRLSPKGKARGIMPYFPKGKVIKRKFHEIFK